MIIFRSVSCLPATKPPYVIVCRDGHKITAVTQAAADAALVDRLAWVMLDFDVNG